MTLFYKLLYRLGLTPWERTAELPLGQQLSAALDGEQDGREPPYGRALDLGCGSGIWSVELAKRGWEVTGVEIVSKALRRARERARKAGAEVSLLGGDVTDLGSAGLDGGFRLILDFGTIHGLGDRQREAAGGEVTALAADGATMLVLAFAPGRRGPLPRGMAREEIEVAFPAWTVLDEQPLDTWRSPRVVRNAKPRLYRLRHQRGSGSGDRKGPPTTSALDDGEGA